MSRFTIHKAGIDEGTCGLAILEEETEVALYCLLGTLLIGALARTLCIIVEGCSGDGTPIVGIDIAVGLTLAEPVAVPVADGYLVHAIRGLVPLQGFEGGQQLLGSAEVFLFASSQIDLAEELHGRGDDRLFVVDFELRKVQAVFQVDISSGLEVVE